MRRGEKPGRSVALQQALEIVALFLRPARIGEPAAQLFEHLARALGDVGAAVQRALERAAAIAGLAPERIASGSAAARPSACRPVAASAALTVSP